MDCSLVLFRHAPNTGWRKSWACADASGDAVRLAFMAVKGEMGYPSVLSAPFFGIYDSRFAGRAFEFQRPYGDYIIQNSMFKFVAAGMHGQSAVECGLKLHPLVKDRIADIERVVIHSQDALMRIMDKSGPLYNFADRDHCVQYVVAVPLLYGRMEASDFEDAFASADPRIDELRAKMTVVENPQYTKDFVDPAKRSSANAVQVFFRDGTSTPKIEVEYPMGHPKRRKDFSPILRKRIAGSIAKRFPSRQTARLLELYDDPARLDAMAVHEFVGMLVA